MLLGPPRVERDGVAVAFDTRKALALLAHLALAERPRPRDVLAELLWPGSRRRARARRAAAHASRRCAAWSGSEAVDATRDQVVLVRGPAIAVDVDRFRADAASGRLESAAGRFRGEFLEGFGLRDAPAFEDWQRAETDGLRRELGAVLGQLVEATGELAHARRWLELDPLNEPAHRALIRIYAAQGERAAALAQYRECVRTLSRELGVPPLAETTRLYESISEGSLDAPQVAPAPARAALPAAPLVGRDREWTALLERWRGIGGDGRVAVIEGEPGIGKTRLAEELLEHVRSQGAAVIAGRGFEEESTLAYGPVLEALRGRLREDEGWIAALSERSRAEAARLLPEIGARRRADPRRPRRPGTFPRRRVGHDRRRGGRPRAWGAARRRRPLGGRRDAGPAHLRPTAAHRAQADGAARVARAVRASTAPGGRAGGHDACARAS
jgi:DNA-binding SARP family transcriptional activator